MAAFMNTLYSSFASVVPSSSDLHRSGPTYSEMQLLKVTAPKYDLEKFEKELVRIIKTVGIRAEIKVIVPSRKHEERLRRAERRQKENFDFLDCFFSDTIPFFHELCVYGTPETQFFQIKAEEGDLDIFNKICRQMIFGKQLQCKLEVTDRRDITYRSQVKNSILGGPNSEPDMLDAMFTDDLSGCNPFLHNMILSAY